MTRKNKVVQRPFIVKTAGGAASQCLALISAIYISQHIKRPFIIKHYPYSVGVYWPLAIGHLLTPDELMSTQGKTRGLVIEKEPTVGNIIESHPLLKSGFRYEKVLDFIRFLGLEAFGKRFRGEWYLNYSMRRLDKTPQKIKIVSGGYFPFRDDNVNKEMNFRFKRAGVVSPYDTSYFAESIPEVVIHYRIGEKRTTYSHPGIHGDGIVDPSSFRKLLEKEGLLDSLKIYVISDEPEAAKLLLKSEGISAKTNSIKGDLWTDLNFMAQAKLLICPWSTVSQFALSIINDKSHRVYYPDSTSEGFKQKWEIEGVQSYKADFLPEGHSIYQANYSPPIGTHHEIYNENKPNSP